MESRKHHAEQVYRAERARLFAAMTRDPQVKNAYLTLAAQWEQLAAEHEHEAAKTGI